MFTYNHDLSLSCFQTRKQKWLFSFLHWFNFYWDSERKPKTTKGFSRCRKPVKYRPSCQLQRPSTLNLARLLEVCKTFRDYTGFCKGESQPRKRTVWLTGRLCIAGQDCVTHRLHLSTIQPWHRHTPAQPDALDLRWLMCSQPVCFCVCASLLGTDGDSSVCGLSSQECRDAHRLLEGVGKKWGFTDPGTRQILGKTYTDLGGGHFELYILKDSHLVTNYHCPCARAEQQPDRHTAPNTPHMRGCSRPKEKKESERARD